MEPCRSLTALHLSGALIYPLSRHTSSLAVSILLSLLILFPRHAGAVGEASTRFNIFVPPNNELLGRDVLIAVTALSDSTIVQIIDDNADGDDDDSYQDLRLDRGQSLIHFLKDGLVNDDSGGKWDGDYFHILATKPVIVLASTASEWQHDWLPADNKRMRGLSYYIYVPPVVQAMRDLDVVAYENDTEVILQRVSSFPRTTTGISQVDFVHAETVFRHTLQEGEDLICRNNIGIQLLTPGATYYLTASKEVTVQMGSLTRNMRDGGGYVPSQNGSVAGSLFYFFLPGESARKELRIVSYQSSNRVDLYGYGAGWQPVQNWTLGSYEHADWINTSVPYDYYRITSTAPVAVFESNALETTPSPYTADINTFVATENGNGAGKKFVVYIPPPAIEGNIVNQRATLSHLLIYSHLDNTTVRIVDTYTGGAVFQQQQNLAADGLWDVKIDLTQYQRIQGTSGSIRGSHSYLTVTSDKNIAVMNTNFNDNWMTYGASVLVPTPVIDLGSDKTEVEDGEAFTLNAGCMNTEDQTLSDATLVLDLPAGVTVTKVENSSELGTSRQAGNQLFWEGFTIPPAAQYSVQVHLTALAGESYVLYDDFYEFRALVSGSHLSDRYSSQASAVVKHIAPQLPLPAPVLVTAVRTEPDTCIALNWTFPGTMAISGFVLTRISTDGVISADTLAAAARSELDCDVELESGYIYYVTAFDTHQASPESNRLDVPAVEPEPRGKFEIFPYPNPLMSGDPGPLYFHYSITQSADITITLVDVAGDRVGTIVESRPAGSGDIALAQIELQADVYFYVAEVVYRNDGSTRRKIGKIAIIK
jgi:hypothetical protein